MLNSLRRKFFIPYFDEHDGNDRLRYYNDVARELELPHEELNANQFKKFCELLEYADKHVPFYSDLYRKKGFTPAAVKTIEDLVIVPQIFKDDIRLQNQKFRSDQYKIEKLIKTGTGGTTSSPIDLYLTRECFSKRRACTLYFFKWYGYQLGDKFALLWGAPRDFPKGFTWKWRFKNFLTERMLMLFSAYLNDEVMQEYYLQLKKFKPKMLQAYPSPLYVFATFLEKHHLQLSIPIIHVTAERLYDYQRKKIEAVFNTKIFNWYGARELGHGAAECTEHKGMHINASGLLFEVIKDGKSVFDEYGDIVVTDLENYAMPLIRYKIGDIGKISKRMCPCGSSLPILEDVIGRHGDIFKKRDGTLIPGISFADRVIEECRGIEGMQIIQKDYELIELNIVKGETYSEKDLNEFQERIIDYFKTDLNFKVNFLDDIPKEPSGKIRFCKCEID